jgi:gluconolactonase
VTTLPAGWNAPQRVVLADSAVPGQTLRVAIFAANAPLSAPPSNYVWIRSAAVDFYAQDRLRDTASTPLEVTRLDPALDAIISSGSQVELLATGFTFTEGPVWIPSRPNQGALGDGGFLLFSEPNANLIHRYTPAAGGGELSIFRTRSGYSGPDVKRYRQPGSNGLALDPQGRVTICEHGNRRVTRLEPNGSITVLADAFQGQRLNSPNDLAYRSDGALFFTDPPFGLPGLHSDPARQTPAFGVYALVKGDLRLIDDGFTGPNGIALSPDEKTLYVGNWDDHAKVVKAFDLAPDGSLSNQRTFIDLTSAPGEDAIDGVKTDRAGNVYISGPGGVWIVSPAGTPLGLVNAPEHAHNFTFGDDDGRSLYLCARSGLYRLRVNIPGAR